MVSTYPSVPARINIKLCRGFDGQRESHKSIPPKGFRDLEASLTEAIELASEVNKAKRSCPRSSDITPNGHTAPTTTTRRCAERRPYLTSQENRDYLMLLETQSLRGNSHVEAQITDEEEDGRPEQVSGGL